MHILMSSYLCDNRESENLLEMKCGNQTKNSCYHCLLRKLGYEQAKTWNRVHAQRKLKIPDMHSRSERDEKTKKWKKLDALSQTDLFQVFYDHDTSHCTSVQNV